MSRQLWLKANATLDSDAVVYPASTEDVELILDFLEATPTEQEVAASQLRRSLSQQAATPPDRRRAIPVTRPDGLYVLLPSRLSAWLLAVLSAPPETRNDVRRRLSERLLSNSLTAECMPAGGE